MDLILRRRKGFVKLALQAGADLVPVMAFGENEQYHRVHVQPGSWLDRLQTATKKASHAGAQAARAHQSKFNMPVARWRARGGNCHLMKQCW